MDSCTAVEQPVVQYRGWLISTKLINGKLWVRFAHPRDKFPRYGYPVTAAGIDATISYVRLIIDLAIKLEKQAEHNLK